MKFPAAVVFFFLICLCGGLLLTIAMGAGTESYRVEADTGEFHAPADRVARNEKICRCCFYDPVRNWHCAFMEVSRCRREGGMCWDTGYPPAAK